MASPTTNRYDTQTTRRFAPAPGTAILFLLFSALYFADTLMRASLKAFWYDELLTVYLCRLPTFHATWAAVLNGCDFNPPLFYLSTRMSEALFGEGLIASRLPAIVGFWVFCICLYTFTSRRCGRLCGLVAALTPFFTVAQYYSYEARAYGLVLGWFGLMLLCWQRAREHSSDEQWWKNPWMLAMSLSFLGGLLSHAYAIYLVLPFFLVEVVSACSRRRIPFGTAIALLAPILLVAPIFLRINRNLKMFGLKYGHDHPLIHLQSFLLTTFGPAIACLLILISLLAWHAMGRESDARPVDHTQLSKDELVLAFAFLLLPIVGIVVTRLTNGQYQHRYFLVSVGAFAVLVAQLVSAQRRRRKIAIYYVFAMTLLISADCLHAIRAVQHHSDLVQVEPASRYIFSPNTSVPLFRNWALLQDTSKLDILVTEELQYFYLFNYAPPDIRRRLIFGASTASDFPLTTYRLLNRWADCHFQTATYTEFFATHKDFLVYGSSNGLYNGQCLDCLQQFLDAGYTPRSVNRDADMLLEHFSR